MAALDNADDLKSRLRRFGERQIVREFLRFVAVGALTTSVLFVALFLLKEFAHWPAWLAALCGYALGGVAGYVLNRSYTFGVRNAFAVGLVKYATVVALGALVNAGIVWVLTQFGLYYLLAQCVSTALVLIWNFLGSRLFVFRPDA